MKIGIYTLAISFILASFLPIGLFAQEEEMKEMSEEEMFEKYMELIAPNENHEWLAKFEGEWEAEITSWWEPNADPNTYEGEAEYEMIMDGRYLEQEVEMDMGEFGDFEGMGLTAYDKVGNTFINTWVDNMGTGILTMKGQRQGDILILIGTYTDPMTMQDETHRMTIRWENEDKHVMEYYVSKPGKKEFLSMRAIYIRE